MALAALLTEEDRPDEAEELQREALSIRRSLARRDPAFLPDAAASCANLGILLGRADTYGEAEELLREALGIYRSLRGGHAMRYAAMVARTCFDLALILDRAGRPAEVEPLLREAAECYRALAAGTVDGDGPALIPESGPVLGTLGELLVDEGRPDEAEPLFREALSMYEVLARANPGREDFRRAEERLRADVARLVGR